MNPAREIARDDAGRADYGVYVSYYHRQCNVTSASSRVRDLRSGPKQPPRIMRRSASRDRCAKCRSWHTWRVCASVYSFLVGINPDRGFDDDPSLAGRRCFLSQDIGISLEIDNAAPREREREREREIRAISPSSKPRNEDRLEAFPSCVFIARIQQRRLLTTH